MTIKVKGKIRKGSLEINELLAALHDRDTLNPIVTYEDYIGCLRFIRVQATG